MVVFQSDAIIDRQFLDELTVHLAVRSVVSGETSHGQAKVNDAVRR